MKQTKLFFSDGEKTGLHFLLIFFVFLSFSSLSAQEITFFPSFGESGFYQDKYPITKAQYESLIVKNKIAYAYWQQAKKRRTLSLVALAAEIGFFAWEYAIVLKQNDIGVLPLVGAAGATIVSVGFSLSSAKMLKMSVLEYNDGLNTKTTLNLGTTRNGVGLVMKF